MPKLQEQKEQQVTNFPLGATVIPGKGVHFKVWAPLHLTLKVEIPGKGRFSLKKEEKGFFGGTIEEAQEGDLYWYVLENGLKRADPVSRFLPNGVHGPTQIVDPNQYTWNDNTFLGVNIEKALFYELHVGTFTQKGTFEGVCEKIPYLKELGVTCVELMPLCQCPGRWNWGYDGVSLFAIEKNYGGPQALKNLIDQCHQAGIGVCVDVVYNHLGPEGNYLAEFGPYFSDRYHTPWGKGFNYDGPYSDEVRAFILQNVHYWVEEYHVDVLRLDAVHGIFDFSATHLLEEIADIVHEKREKKVWVVAESDSNDSSLIKERSQGGAALDALWNDDFHHAAHVLLTKEGHGYYADYDDINDVKKAIKQGFVYDGIYSAFRKKRQGNNPEGIPLQKFIHFVQNHDQIGNRPSGERLSTLVSKPLNKVAAVLTLLTPCLPLLFMGQEYGERAPFEYFVDFEEEKLMRSIFEGRKREFKRPDMPYPGKETYFRSHLTWEKDEEIALLYQELIALRKKHPPTTGLTSKEIVVKASEEMPWLAWEYPTLQGKWLGVFCCFAKKGGELSLPLTHTTQQCLYCTDSKVAFTPHEPLTFYEPTALVVV